MEPHHSPYQQRQLKQHGAIKSGTVCAMKREDDEFALEQYTGFRTVTDQSSKGQTRAAFPPNAPNRQKNPAMPNAETQGRADPLSCSAGRHGTI